MYQSDCMSQISGLLDCYGQVQAATAFIKQVLASTPMAMKGVTDGSNAQPGQVGEWIRLAGTMPYTTGPSAATIPIGTLQPGDWDCWLWAIMTTAIHDITFNLTPPPVGFSDNLTNQTFAATDEIVTPASTTVRASLTVPTLIPVFVQINQSAAGPGAGTATMIFSARRVR